MRVLLVTGPRFRLVHNVFRYFGLQKPVSRWQRGAFTGAALPPSRYLATGQLHRRKGVAAHRAERMTGQLVSQKQETELTGQNYRTGQAARETWQYSIPSHGAISGPQVAAARGSCMGQMHGAAGQLLTVGQEVDQ